jgi:hypothetical protein
LPGEKSVGHEFNPTAFDPNVSSPTSDATPPPDTDNQDEKEGNIFADAIEKAFTSTSQDDQEVGGLNFLAPMGSLLKPEEVCAIAKYHFQRILNEMVEMQEFYEEVKSQVLTTKKDEKMPSNEKAKIIEEQQPRLDILAAKRKLVIEDALHALRSLDSYGLMASELLRTQIVEKILVPAAEYRTVYAAKAF